MADDFVTPLSQEQIKVLCAFEGFGRLDAPVWFIGMEEAGDNPNLLHIRATWQPVMDLKDAHIALNITKHHENSFVLQSTWRPMCVLMVLSACPDLYPSSGAFTRHSQTEQRFSHDQKQRLMEALRCYQSTRLGRSGDLGETMLCELLPIPKPAENSYPFAKLLPMWKDHEDYKFRVLPGRKELISRRIQQNKPEIVVAYGKKFWNDYQEIFKNTIFLPPNKEQCNQLPSWLQKNEKPTGNNSKMLFGLYDNNTLVILIEHLTRVNDYARLSELARFINQWRSRQA